MNTKNATAETLALIKAQQALPDTELLKAWTQSASAIQGITAYDLEGPSKILYPVITPLRNSIPRASGRGGIQANWRSVTGININNLSAGVSQGNRGGVIATTTTNNLAAYAGLGLEDNVTYEADYAATGFDDVKALAVEGLLRSLMIQEEKIILGGNASVALGATPTPSLSTATTGGTLVAQTWSVICVALTMEGFLNASIAGGIPVLVTRTNADSSVDTYGGGSALKSAAAAQATGGGSVSTISGTVAAVNNAMAYAWFWGLAGSELLGAITNINSVFITAAATGTQNASAASADNSRNTLIFDGLLSQVATSGSNSYIKIQATGVAGTGTPLTADGVGGIVEIDTALKSFWDNYRLSPTTIWVNSQEQKNIALKTLAGNANTAQRFSFNVDQGMISGGTMVKSYLNKYTMTGMKEIPIKLHPNLPAGTILFTCEELPYPLSNVPQVLRVLCRRDYYQIEWPRRTRKYEYGVYADEVLQNYFPPAFGVITNIGNG